MEYLYRDGWVAEQLNKRDSDYLVLARLYALGERLQAKDFQRAALRQFLTPSPPYASFKLSDQCICELLEIACGELPERLEEDPLRAHIFWYAASRLKELQGFDYFLHLLDTYKELGKALCLRAGNGSGDQPRKPPEPPPQRFKAESTFRD